MDYETKLEEWKSKHGLNPKAETNQDELAMAAEEKGVEKGIVVPWL
jgi:hypothetical protein